MFGADDHAVKRGDRLVDWTKKSEEVRFLAHNVTGSMPRRLRRFVQVAVSDVDELHHDRCDRGAEIAAMLAFPAATQEAVRALDEHWDGRGRPRGLRGDEIPVLARIVCLAQTTEIFVGTYGVEAAFAMAAERRGTWFDPALVDALLGLRGDERLWRLVSGQDTTDPLAGLEPDDLVLEADESRIDRVTAAFSLIIDAKSPFTARHSDGVAAYAVDIGTELGLSASALRDLRRAGLLHDLGKLATSNLILDKGGPLNDEERTEMQRHPAVTERLLRQVAPLRPLAVAAAGHHERIDGRGYHRGVLSGELPHAARILAVADVFEAMTADRPYRAGMPVDQALGLMARDVGRAFEPAAFSALEAFVSRGGRLLAA